MIAIIKFGLTVLILFEFLYSNQVICKLTCPVGYVGDNCEIECGLRYSTPNVKIVGGTEAVANSWPSIAFIRTCNGSSCYICGGTLIDRSTVLTAAHCIKPTGYTYTVYLGLHDRSTLSNSNISPAVAISVTTVIKHGSYNDVTLKNDIALLILSTNVTLNNYIQVACLPSFASSSYPGYDLTSWAAGWGTTSYGGSTSNLLRNVLLNIYSGVYCNIFGITNWSSQICAGEYSGGKDTCQGDSGGPLYIRDTVGNITKYVVAGITSYGDECAKVNRAGVYTRVSYYLNWISANSPTFPNIMTTTTTTTTTLSTTSTTRNSQILQTVKNESNSFDSNKITILIGLFFLMNILI